MDKNTQQQYRVQLLAKRHELAEDIKTLQEDGFSLGQDGTQDLGDDAANTTARRLNLGLSENDRAIIKEIDKALEKMDSDEFGLCEECDEPIPEQRLKAIPYATLCVECKAGQERQG